MRLPRYLRRPLPLSRRREVKRLLRDLDLRTVCEESRCPNIGECFSRPTATFMILGKVCTRRCGFCAVQKGGPQPVDPEEPARVAEAAARLGLRHVVITSVNRDDLPDGGAAHFAATIQCVRSRLPRARVEVLTPDFQGNREAVARVVAAGPDLYNHNLETVPRLYHRVRPGARYETSLAVLRWVRELRPDLPTKSGLMVGLGEREEEVVAVMRDLRAVGCEILTIGQYLPPDRESLPVEEFVSPAQFRRYRQWGKALGFRKVFASPWVRSSYMAERVV